MKVNYLYPLNSELLVDIYIWIESIEDATKKINIFNRLKKCKCYLVTVKAIIIYKSMRLHINKIMEKMEFSCRYI
ncbi:MAG: hypothetical protein ACLS28_15130 [Clostridium neonatale]